MTYRSIALVCLTCASFSFAPRATGGVVNLLVENDVFSGTDRHYTSGVMFNYISEVNQGPERLADIGLRFPGIDEGDKLQVAFTLGHEIYTPTDILTRDLLPDERPYAGYVYAAAGVTAANPYEEIDTWRINIGIIGPSARAEQMQNNLHKLIDIDQANGWDNQLRDEPVFSASYERKWLDRGRTKTWSNGLAFEYIPHANVTLGTPVTDMGLGITLRIGQGLNRDYGPPRIRPSLATSQYYETGIGRSWYLFAALEARAVGYNLFLDGNTFKNSHSVDRKPVIADVQAGFVWNSNRFRVTYTWVLRSREFDSQENLDLFGSLSLSFRI